jgi:dTDP-4-dehydrorhamnose reductase
MVFDGDAAPYDEAAPTNPLSVYGKTKAMAEQAALAYANAAVIRLPLMFGRPRDDRASTYTRQLESLSAGQPLKLFTDEFRTPLHLADAAAAVIAVARSDFAGIIHAGGPLRLSRFDLIREVANRLSLPMHTVEQISRLSIPGAEERPADLSLKSDLFRSRFPNVVLRAIHEISEEELSPRGSASLGEAYRP